MVAELSGRETLEHPRAALLRDDGIAQHGREMRPGFRGFVAAHPRS